MKVATSVYVRQLKDSFFSLALQVVRKVYTRVVEVLDAEEIAQHCLQAGLIAWTDREDIGRKSNAALLTRAAVNGILLDMLKKNKNEGYFALKDILRKWKSPHSYAVLLERIEAQERSVVAASKEPKGSFKVTL